MTNRNVTHIKWTSLLAASLLVSGLLAVPAVFAADAWVDEQALSVAPGSVNTFQAMTVRIVGPLNTLVVDARSTSTETFYWTASGMPDGKYRFEAVELTYDPALDSGEEDGDTGEKLERVSGSFEIQNDSIVIPKEPVGEGETSFMENAWKRVGIVAQAVADFFCSEAHAVDLTASSSIPTVFFDDTQIVTHTNEWYLRALEVGGSGSAYSTFRLYDAINNTIVFSIPNSVNDSNTLVVNGNGDITLANSAVTIERTAQDMTIGNDLTLGSGFFFDSSLARLGIGVLTPGYEIDIHDTVPEIEFYDESDSTIAHIEYNAPWLALEGNIQQDVIRMHNIAPANSFVVTDTGDIGMGTSLPTAPLNLLRTDGSARVLVREDSLAVAKRPMFELSNNGAVSFRFIDRSVGRTWTFATTDQPPVGNLIINDPSTPAREMMLDPAGNVEFRGSVRASAYLTWSDRNVKENIQPLDKKEILDKVMKLPITSWNFKEDEAAQRHIGPMAQDFHALFNIGESDKYISLSDTSGIALAAIQSLGKEVRTKEAQIEILQKQVADLQKVVQSLVAANRLAMAD